MKTKVLHINYPSSDAENIGRITAALRDSILEEFDKHQISFSFSSNKQSGYIMVYPTKPVLTIRISNHSPTGQAADPLTIQTEGARVTINAEQPYGKVITEEVVRSTLQGIKRICALFGSKMTYE